MKKIDAGTVTRTVLLILAIVNQALVLFGKNTLPFTDDQISQFISLAFTIITSAMAYWKNNSWTKEAKEAQGYLNSLKQVRKNKEAQPAPSVGGNTVVSDHLEEKETEEVRG